MCLHRNVGNLAAGCRIDHRQCPVAVSDEDAMGCGIDADIVCIAAQLNSSRRLVVVSFKQSYRTVSGIGDIEHIGRRLVADALRLLQPWNPANHPSICEIDNANAVIAQFGNEQALPLQINRHVVDPTTHIAERKPSLKLEQHRLCRFREGIASRAQHCEGGGQRGDG